MTALKESLFIKSFDFDPGVTTAVDVGYVDMQDFESFMVGFFRTVGTSDTTLKIYASAAANGGSPVLKPMPWPLNLMQLVISCTWKSTSMSLTTPVLTYAM